jgi:hypothetical protein
MPGKVDAAEQRIAKRKGDLVIAPFGLRVRPGDGLLRAFSPKAKHSG